MISIKAPGKILSLIILLIISQGSFAGQSRPSERQGAKVFYTYCTLCHGNYGQGEGALPFALKKYPNTNLMDARFGKSQEILREVILHGGYNRGLSDLMPPWGDELTYYDIESVILYVDKLHKDNDGAISLLEDVRKTTPVIAKKSIGRILFKGRCSLCHGKEGEGNGRMAKRLSPKPSNLVKSRVPASYLKKIILGGGKSVGRSSAMPPWGDELSPSEIESIILHLKSLRLP